MIIIFNLQLLSNGIRTTCFETTWVRWMPCGVISGKKRGFIFYYYVTHYTCIRNISMHIWFTKKNRCGFNNIQTSMLEPMENIKHYPFWWLKANKTIFIFCFQRWWSDPFNIWILTDYRSCVLLCNRLYFGWPF